MFDDMIADMESDRKLLLILLLLNCFLEEENSIFFFCLYHNLISICPKL